MVLNTAPHEKLAKTFSKQKNVLQSSFLERASFPLKVLLFVGHHFFGLAIDSCFINPFCKINNYILYL